MSNEQNERGVIRELVFSWEMWAIWYAVTGIVFGGLKLLRKGNDSEKPLELIAYTHQDTETQDVPAYSKISLNIEDDEPRTVIRGEVIDIRSRPEKPDWMK